MEKIDKLDRQILNIISKNARIPFKDVAEECGVSRAAIHQRVQRMMDMNVIVGSGYHINPKILGYNTCTYIGVKLERGSMYKDVVPEFEKIPEVVECHFTTGPYTLLIKLYARDNEHLMESFKVVPCWRAITESALNVSSFKSINFFLGCNVAVIIVIDFSTNIMQITINPACSMSFSSAPDRLRLAAPSLRRHHPSSSLAAHPVGSSNA